MHNLAEFFQVKNSTRFEREWKDLICTVFGVSKDKENYINEKNVQLLVDEDIVTHVQRKKNMNFLKQQVWEGNSNNSKLKTYKQKETAEILYGAMSLWTWNSVTF